jgi:hypothetical protein
VSVRHNPGIWKALRSGNTIETTDSSIVLLSDGERGSTNTESNALCPVSGHSFDFDVGPRSARFYESRLNFASFSVPDMLLQLYHTMADLGLLPSED